MNTNNEPSNINQARRLIRTQEKALTLRAEAYHFDLAHFDADDNNGIVDVFKPIEKGVPVYHLTPDYKIFVNMNPVFTNQAGPVCDCPDFKQHGDYCKHTLALDDLLQENAMVAQYEASQQELRESIGDWFVD